MTRAARRPVTALLFVLVGASSACNTWRVQSVAPEKLWRESSPPSTVRLRLQDSTWVVLKRPHLVHDSVTGTLKGAPTTVPLSDVTEVAVRGFSPGKTAGLVGGIAGVFVAAGLAVCASGGCSPSFSWGQ
jgi:hypothetical protein